MVELTQDYLQSILHYDKESGLFTWIINKPGVKFGKKAGTNSHGYNQININSTKATSPNCQYFEGQPND